MEPKTSYDRVAREYARHFHCELAHKPFDRAMLERFARSAADAASPDSAPILDLGCGPGHISHFLAERGLSPIGIDLSPGMIMEARRLNPGIEFRTGDMRALDWPDSSFVGVVAAYSIIHLARSEIISILGEFRRVMVARGPLLVSFHVGTEVVHRDEWWGKPIDLDFTFFAVDEMEGYLREAGFTDIETFERNPLPEVEAQTRRAYVFAHQ